MYYKKYQSSYCTLIMVSDGESLTGLYFDSYNDNLNHKETDLSIFHTTAMWLDCYFGGKKPDFIPQIHLEGTSFQKEVWDILLTIPYGKYMTYGDIASLIAKKRGIKLMSAQAVGQAVSKNPIAIIIPCHRVLGQNKALTGYAYGLENKRMLLKLEKII